MINTKAVIAIAVVAILAMGGIGVAIYNMGDNGGNNVTIDSVLPVYGNANNDDRIDQADIDIINDIINERRRQRIIHSPTRSMMIRSTKRTSNR